MNWTLMASAKYFRNDSEGRIKSFQPHFWCMCAEKKTLSTKKHTKVEKMVGFGETG